jgi:hypothetical protein
MLQDDDVRSLAESLREMVGVAAECPDLPVVQSTTNVIEEIGRVSLQIALLIYEYAKSSLIGWLLLLLLIWIWSLIWLEFCCRANHQIPVD